MPNPDDDLIDPTPLTAFRLPPLADTIRAAIPSIEPEWVAHFVDHFTAIELTPFSASELARLFIAVGMTHIVEPSDVTDEVPDPT